MAGLVWLWRVPLRQLYKDGGLHGLTVACNIRGMDGWA